MKCSNCGKELYDAARKCPYCGVVFPENEEKIVKVENVEEKKEPVFLGFIITTLIAVAAFFGSVTLIIWSHNKNNGPLFLLGIIALVVTVGFCVAIGIIYYKFDPKYIFYKNVEKYHREGEK